ncbi:MAG: restriction endonuclease [Shewanella sp.]
MSLTANNDRDALQKLSVEINPISMLDLACDLLFIRGHHQIRITDGPGDGARDIHSLDQNGNIHITQCKYHNSPDKSVSSRELAELPIALTKFSCSKGLFITNIKISPQGKREYLSDYPNFDLDFTDGLTLIREIRANPILRARWIDCSGQDWSFSLTFPVLIRRHLDDTPILPEFSYENDLLDKIVDAVNKLVKPIVSTSTTGFIDEEHFPLYREPKRLTQEEGLLPQLRCSIIKCSGIKTIADKQFLEEAILTTILNVIGEKETHFSVCIGIPALVDLSGSAKGHIVRLGSDAITKLKTPCGVYDEYNFFSLDSSKWTATTDARVSQADYIRLFSDNLNALIDFTHISTVSRAQSRCNRTIRLNQLESWRLSKFALSKYNPDSWLCNKVPPPDEKIKWPWNDSWLCGWLHTSLLNGFVSVPSTTSESSFFPVDEVEETSRLTALHNALLDDDNFELIEPNRARHMLASISYDPFEEEGDVVFRTADLILDENNIPTPALPSQRNVEATIFISETPNDYIDSIIEKSHINNKNIKTTHKVKEITKPVNVWMVVINFNFIKINDLPSSSILDEIYTWLDDFISEMKLKIPTLETHTKDAWKNLTGVTLGLPWYESDMVYMTLGTDDGIVEIRGKNK